MLPWQLDIHDDYYNIYKRLTPYLVKQWLIIETNNILWEANKITF